MQTGSTRGRAWTRVRLALLSTVVVAVTAVTVSGCGAGGGDTGGDTGGAFDLVLQPEFVQGMYPDIPVTVLVTVEDAPEAAGEVSLAADFSHGSASVEPATITAGGIAEVTFAAEPVQDEVEATLTVTATRGEVERSDRRQVFVIPGEDDREEVARQLLAVFAGWLEENHPELGITPQTEFAGSLVAPRLLVVSHYLFENDAHELGVSWHIMVAPDDWSEIYLRPRDSLVPTRAFRLSSWSAALAGEDVEVTEVVAPAEVVR